MLSCQFLVLVGNRFWFYILTYLEYHTVVVLCQFFLVLAGNSFWYVRSPYSCGVVLVFWFWREIVFGVTYVLSVQYSGVVVFLKNDYSISLF